MSRQRRESAQTRSGANKSAAKPSSRRPPTTWRTFVYGAALFFGAVSVSYFLAKSGRAAKPVQSSATATPAAKSDSLAPENIHLPGVFVSAVVPAEARRHRQGKAA